MNEHLHHTRSTSHLAVAYLWEDRWGLALDLQRDLITGYAAAHGFEILRWYEDTDHPGYARLEWDEATDAARNGPAWRILYTSVDRLGTTARELLKLTEDAEEDGYRLEGLDGTNSETLVGRTAFGMAASQVEMAHRLRKEGQHALAFSTEEMREMYLILRDASNYGDTALIDRYAKRFNLRGW